MNLEDLNRELKRKHLVGFWESSNDSLDQDIPLSTIVQPYVWKWADIYEGLKKAGDLVSLEQSERRTIRPTNPGVPGFTGATTTIHMSVQLVKPGEVAKAHRHTFTAIRFVIKGGGACTTVEGERFSMAPGDLILTPNWTWHDHYNGSNEDIVWLDGHDGPLTKLLEMVTVENFPTKQQQVEVSPDFSLHQYGFARPDDLAPSSADLPFRYPWNDTYRALQKLAATAGDPYNGVHLRYINPRNLGPTVHTIGCEIQMLRPKEATKSHRHTATTVYHAFRGSGRTVIGDKVLEWDQGDIFTVPLWSWHRHENLDNIETILFSINDRPAKEALGFYREEKEPL